MSAVSIHGASREPAAPSAKRVSGCAAVVTYTWPTEPFPVVQVIVAVPSPRASIVGFGVTTSDERSRSGAGREGASLAGTDCRTRPVCNTDLLQSFRRSAAQT